MAGNNHPNRSQQDAEMRRRIARDSLINACVEIVDMNHFLEMACELTAQTLTTEQYTTLEQTQALADDLLTRHCDALREAIRGRKL